MESEPTSAAIRCSASMEGRSNSAEVSKRRHVTSAPAETSQTLSRRPCPPPGCLGLLSEALEAAAGHSRSKRASTLPCRTTPSSNTRTLEYEVSSNARSLSALPPYAGPLLGSLGNDPRGCKVQNSASASRQGSGTAGPCKSSRSFVEPEEIKDCPSSSACRKATPLPSQSTLQNAWRSAGKACTAGTSLQELGPGAGLSSRTPISSGRRHCGQAERARDH
mmetsp:Transcript_98896/g.308654  ORF Transcript_98896/g.308654 Transcript_98896/m.308654 type:complete len:221 (+) Transcript_98896:80-742(+)